MNGEGLELDDRAVAIDLRQFGEFRQADRRQLGARLGEARERVGEGRGDGGVEATRRRSPRSRRWRGWRAARAARPRPPRRERMLSSAAQQDTLIASGPTESRLGASGKTPFSDTRPCVGLKPTIPQKAAGMRHEPPVSVPSVAGVMPSATPTAPPEVEPPGICPRARSQGLERRPVMRVHAERPE